jgi:HAD superfamily hydrolase (TIGR01509 family)
MLDSYSLMRKAECSGNVDAVIFDMDGVLCDSEPFLAEAAGRMFAERFGLEVKPDEFLPFVGTGENRYLGGVAEKYGLCLAMPADKLLTYQIYLHVIRGRLKPLPGVSHFVQECRKRGLKLAVATSADRIKMEGNLKEISLAPETFDVCVNGSEVERKKPDPQIFAVAAERLGVKPEKCLVLEDSPHGIIAAKAIGAPCLALTTSFQESELRSAGADWTASDLVDLSEDIRNRLGI